MYKHLDRPQEVGHFLCLFDISAFAPLAEFTGRMDQTIAAIKGGKKRPGVEEILVPGERSERKAKQNRKDGINVDPATAAEIEKLCAELGVPYRLGGA